MKKQGGFTLTELLIAMALIAITTAIMVPQLLNKLPTFHAKGASRDIQTKAMMARMRAIQENKTYAILFTLGATDSFKLQRYNTVTFAWDDAGAVGEATTDVDVTPSGADCTANRIVFSPNGSAAGCDTVTVKITDETSWIITINPYTGHITPPS